MIDLMPNETFFVQMAIFLVTLAGLHFLVFRPILRILARREELTEGNRQKASELQAKTETLLANYENQMKEARQKGISLKSEQTQAGEAKAQEILAQTRGDIEAKLQKQRQQVQGELKEAGLVLRKYSRDLSQEMAEKLLGRKVSS